MADLAKLQIAFILAEAKAGRFGPLARELADRGVPPAIVRWVRAGCKTARKRGAPARDPSVETELVDFYSRHRGMIPPEDLPEKSLLLNIKEVFSIGERQTRVIIKKWRRECIARAAKDFGISEAEAEALWNQSREARWTEWRAKRERSRKRKAQRAAARR